MKRVFALVLCLCMVFAMVPAASAATGNVSLSNGTTTSYFNSVEEALIAAEGGTIKLLADVSAGQIIIPKDFTLDLNGYALTADMLVVFNGKIVDSGENGKIVVEQNLMKVIGDNDGNLPVWNAAEACYTLTTVRYQQMIQVAEDLSSAKYIFVPNLDKETIALLADGGKDNGISVKVLLSWNNGSSQQIFTFSEELVATVYGSANASGTLGKVFQLTVTGFAGIEDMTACAVVESTAGGKAVNDASKVALPEPEPTVPETTEPTVPETEPTVPETEPTTPAEPVTETFAMADLDKDAAGGTTASRNLGDKVVFTISSGWFTTQARIYQNANGVLASTVGMSSVTLNMGYKTNTFDVYTSEDGEEWTLYKEGVAYTSAYSDITIDFDTPVNYVKIDANKAQIRIQNISITFVGGASEPSEPEATEPTVPETEPTTPVEPEDPYAAQAAIMEQIKALAAGENLENVTLTGEITKINNAYDATYKNITVTISVFGTEDVLKCYRIKGDAASALAVGDTITVSGTVTNYTHSSGDTELEFVAGSQIVAHIPGEGGSTEPEATEPPATEPPVTSDTLTIAEAIELGLSKAHNAYTSEKYYVTGEITEVYNTTYGNMKITDEAGNILTVYGTYSADGSTRYDALDVKPVAGDTVTVYGVVGQYSGAAQIKNGWIVKHTTSEGGATEPEATEPPATEPPATEPPVTSDTLTIAEAIELGKTKEHNNYTTEKYYVTGVITAVNSTTYGNMWIADEAGNVLTIYGSYDATGANRYDAMAVKPVVGDTITVYGIIGQYSNEAQMKNGWIVEHIPGEGTDEPEPEEPSEGTSAKLDFNSVSNCVSQDGNSQVWSANGITLTNAKNKSNTNVAKYSPIRLYQGSSVTIECAGMTKIVFTCDTYKNTYASALQASIGSQGTVTVSGVTVTVVLNEAVDSFTIAQLTAQVRLDDVTVYTK